MARPSYPPLNFDHEWFIDHGDRKTRIRLPGDGEFIEEWRMLGMHHESRRRVLVWRVPENNPKRRLVADGLMRIPFLKYADETIEDNDAVLLAILDEMMKAEMANASS